MRAILRNLAAWALCIGLLVCWGIFAFYPHLPSSAAGWAVAVLVGVPLAAFLEIGGKWVFERPFLERWPTLARIAYGVVVMVLLVGAAGSVAWLVMLWWNAA